MSRTRRVPLVEAAQVLGVSKEAVRKRVQRGTLPSDVGEDGRRYVYLDAVGDDGPPGGLHGETWPPGAGGRHHDPREELIATLRDQLAEEREARRRADTIIAQLTQANATLAARIPELEAPTEPREPSESAGEPSDTPEPRPTTAEQQEQASRPQEERSWWRRMFGG